MNQSFTLPWCIVLLASTLAGEAAPVIAPEVSRVASLIKAENYREALAATDLALKQKPEDVTLLRLRGVSLMEENRIDEAVRVLRQAVGLDPESVACRYYLAQALAYQGRVHEAVRLLEAVQAAAPQSEYARLSATVLPELRLLAQSSQEIGDVPTVAAQPQKRFSVDLRLAAEYDTNIPARADSDPDPSPKRGGRLAGSANLEYRPLDQKLDSAPVTLGLGYVGYQSLHERKSLQIYDVTQHAGIAYVQRNGQLGGKPYELRLGGRFEFTDVDYHRYSRAIRAEASASLQPAAWTVIALRYGIAGKEFDNDTVLPKLFSRDSLEQSFGVTQFFYLLKNRLILGVGYAYAADDADGLLFQQNSHQYTALAQIALPGQFTLRTTLEYLQDGYVNFVPSPRRIDDIWRVTNTLSRPLFVKNLSAEVGYLYETSNSTRDFADYQRTVYSIALNYNF